MAACTVGAGAAGATRACLFAAAANAPGAKRAVRSAAPKQQAVVLTSASIKRVAYPHPDSPRRVAVPGIAVRVQLTCRVLRRRGYDDGITAVENVLRVERSTPVRSLDTHLNVRQQRCLEDAVGWIDVTPMRSRARGRRRGRSATRPTRPTRSAWSATDGGRRRARCVRLARARPGGCKIGVAPSEVLLREHGETADAAEAQCMT